TSAISRDRRSPDRESRFWSAGRSRVMVATPSSRWNRTSGWSFATYLFIGARVTIVNETRCGSEGHLLRVSEVVGVERRVQPAPVAKVLHERPPRLLGRLAGLAAVDAG